MEKPRFYKLDVDKIEGENPDENLSLNRAFYEIRDRKLEGGWLSTKGYRIEREDKYLDAILAIKRTDRSIIKTNDTDVLSEIVTQTRKELSMIRPFSDEEDI